MIRFGAYEILECEPAVPIVAGDTISFYAIMGYPEANMTISLINDIEAVIPAVATTYKLEINEAQAALHITISLPPNLAIGRCYRVKIEATEYEQQTIYPTIVYSNPLVVQPRQCDFAYVEYFCNEDAFGFLFDSIRKRPTNSNTTIRQRMPFHIINPQFKTEDEVYQTLDGENILLYSAFSEEYELETDYIPYQWHKIIITALACDHISIDGFSVFKSAEYSIDWDNYLTDDCGNKLLKATCKVLVNHREINSNCTSILAQNEQPMT